MNFSPHTDEKPAGVENTFLLCPAPVVDDVGKYVAVFVLKNEHLALWEGFHVLLGSRSFLKHRDTFLDTCVYGHRP